MTISASAGTVRSLPRHLTTGERRPVQGARDLELVLVERRDRLRRQQGQRVDPDHDRDGQRRPFRLGHGEEMCGLTRQDQRAEPIRAAELEPQDRDVLRPGLRVARRRPGPAVM